MAAQRPYLELCIRWMQEIRRFKPSTVSRRFSVAAGFYRTCVLDGALEHSPAEHVRRPVVPAESLTVAARPFSSVIHVVGALNDSEWSAITLDGRASCAERPFLLVGAGNVC